MGTSFSFPSSIGQNFGRRKLMKSFLLILTMLGLILSACTPEEDRSLVGSWDLTAYGSEGSTSPALTENESGLTFNEDGTLSGNSGCNGFGGEYTVDGDQIEFGPISSTLMLCDSPIMGQEEAFFQVLMETATYEIEGDRLTITNDDRVLVLTVAAGQ
jgi:heat shock protein HslJ